MAQKQLVGILLPQCAYHSSGHGKQYRAGSSTKYTSGGKHQHYYRRVLSRRLNLLARENTTIACHQVNPTDVRPRYVRFANHQPPIFSINCSSAVGATSAACSPISSDQCWKAERDHADNNNNNNNNNSSKNDPGCWYSQKDYNRILSENQCIIAIARTLLDEHGSVDEEALPFLQGLECFLSPEQAELRQRKVADHVRRVLDSINNSA